MRHGWKTSKSKLNICVFAVAAILLMGGFTFAKYEPELKNVWEPFIDLKSGTSMAIDVAEEDGKPTPPPTEKPKPDNASELIVRVSDHDFYADDKKFIRLSDLAEYLSGGENAKKKIILVDDYANYITYRSVEKRVLALTGDVERRSEK